MSPDTPYRFVEIWVPKNRKGRYTSEHGWPNIVGDFVAPLRAALEERMPAGTNMLFHALQEGHWFQVTWTAPIHWDGTRNWPDHEVLRRVCRAKGFRVKRILRGGDLGGALNGTRWNSQRLMGTALSRRRSCKLVAVMHGICQLYEESLIKIIPHGRKRPTHWAVEAPICQRQNPHGSLFESLTHLLANTTEAKFDVYVTARTGWMNPSNGLNATYTPKAKIEGLHL